MRRFYPFCGKSLGSLWIEKESIKQIIQLIRNFVIIIVVLEYTEIFQKNPYFEVFTGTDIIIPLIYLDQKNYQSDDSIEVDEIYLSTS